ncbi:MAG: exosortase/archaeosortase family protein [Nanoarchaeota archaeon]|nr:exosortase/archaeosortase family protein [Nanoarchaeota archaeon]
MIRFPKKYQKLVNTNKNTKRLNSTLTFLVRLLVLSIPLYIILFFIDFFPIQEMTAIHSVAILQALGIWWAREGATVTILSGTDFFTFIISPDSTAWKSLVFLVALVVAVPKIDLEKRVFGLAIGLPIVWLVNIGRVLAIIGAEQTFGRDAALLTHDVLWRFGLIALVLGIWIVWLRFSLPKKKSFFNRRKGAHHYF